MVFTMRKMKTASTSSTNSKLEFPPKPTLSRHAPTRCNPFLFFFLLYMVRLLVNPWCGFSRITKQFENWSPIHLKFVFFVGTLKTSFKNR